MGGIFSRSNDMAGELAELAKRASDARVEHQRVVLRWDSIQWWVSIPLIVLGTLWAVGCAVAWWFEFGTTYAVQGVAGTAGILGLAGLLRGITIKLGAWRGEVARLRAVAMKNKQKDTVRALKESIKYDEVTKLLDAYDTNTPQGNRGRSRRGNNNRIFGASSANLNRRHKAGISGPASIGSTRMVGEAGLTESPQRPSRNRNNRSSGSRKSLGNSRRSTVGGSRSSGSRGSIKNRRTSLPFQAGPGVYQMAQAQAASRHPMLPRVAKPVAAVPMAVPAPRPSFTQPVVMTPVRPGPATSVPCTAPPAPRGGRKVTGSTQRKKKKRSAGGSVGDGPANNQSRGDQNERTDSPAESMLLSLNNGSPDGEAPQTPVSQMTRQIGEIPETPPSMLDKLASVVANV